MLFDGKFDGVADVEILEGYLDGCFHVTAAALASVAKVTAAAEETGEEIEGVVVVAACVASLLVLLQSFVAVLIVYPSGLLVGERFVGFSDFDKLLMCRFISSIDIMLKNHC